MKDGESQVQQQTERGLRCPKCGGEHFHIIYTRAGW